MEITQQWKHYMCLRNINKLGMLYESLREKSKNGSEGGGEEGGKARTRDYS